MNKDKIILEPEQQAIYNRLVDFVKIKNNKDEQIDINPNAKIIVPDTKIKINENEILLIGYAGTGKTTLIAKFINDIIKNKICKKIAIAAPTHKAVNIAKSKLFDNLDFQEELSNGITVMTIHRLLNYQSYVDTNTNVGNKFFAKGAIDPKWSIYNLIVIDECSMLSNQIITDIMNLKNNEENKNVKIIYVGDPAQLPPVNQTDSKIFNRPIEKLYLDKVIRTSNKEIIDLSNGHRKWIFSQKDEDIPHVGEYVCDKIKLFSNRGKESINWLGEYIDSINGNHIDNNNIILTWTNKNCDKYNDYVRSKIFNKKDLAKYEIGEILIFNDFHKILDINDLDYGIEKTNEKKEEKFINFYTSEQVKLYEIKKSKIRLEKLKNKISNNVPNDMNEKISKIIDSFNKELDVDIEVYEMSVKKISEINDNEKIAPLYKLITIHSASEITHFKITEEFEKSINLIKTKTAKLIKKYKTDNMTKSNHMIFVEKKINKIWINFQSNILDKFAKLNYGYAITVHKSQGSTFNNVFIDISDILENKKTEEMSKCLYTAITRSSNSLKLLI